MPPTPPRLQRITPIAERLLRTLPSLKPINLPDSTVLVLLRHPVPKMHMQLACTGPAVTAFRFAVEFPGAAFAAGENWGRAMKGLLQVVEVRVGQAEAGTVEGVQVGEDEEVELGGDVS